MNEQPMGDAQSEANSNPLAGMLEGRIVHYVMPDGEHRPAIIVRVWDKQRVNGCCNLSVFTDHTNDSHGVDAEGRAYKFGEDCANGLMWQTSRLYSEKYEPNTWHWIERE